MQTSPSRALRIVLRPYQRDALRAIRDRYRAGMRRILLVMPTGSGKTACFVLLPVALGLRPDDKVLILANRDELVEQARDRYAATAPDEMVGIEKAAARVTPMDRVAVASVQTLCNSERRQELWSRWGRPRLVVTDEAHHATAASYRAIYADLGITPTGNVIHVGVTATPRREDNGDLSTVFDGIAYAIDMGTLVRSGYLAPMRAFTVRTKTNLDDLHTADGDFSRSELAAKVDNPARNASVIAAYEDLVPKSKTLVFAASVEHSAHLCRTFLEAGWRAAHIDGDTSKAPRRDTIAAFRDRQIDILCNYSVFLEGFDDPSIETIIVARPTKSASLYQQIIGRALRTHPGKAYATILDVSDEAGRHRVMNLPVLFDLPGGFDLRGRDVMKTAAQYAKIVAEEPMLAGLLDDAIVVERIASLPPRERFSARMREIVAAAKAQNTYLEARILLPRPLSPDFEDLELAWIPCPDGTFRLRVGEDRLAIRTNAIGLGAAWVKRADGTIEALAKGIPQRDVFAAGDAWIRAHHPDRLVLLERGRAWREKRPRKSQRDVLRKHHIRLHPGATRGEASAVIDALRDLWS